MEKEGKPDIRTRYQVADGEIVALQADPECREMSRLVADVNRRVLRVQSHGQPSGEKGRGRYRGFGVEVAREAVDDQEAAACGSSGGRYYSAADEPAQRRGSSLVEQYIEDAEGRPGPVRRTVRHWLYGKPASCCCRQVAAVAGKTIAEASGMRDQAVDRLLVDVYFQPAPERDVASRVLRRASEVSRRMSDRVRSAARRISRRYTEYRARSGGSTRGDAAPGADTLQLRQRHTWGPSAPEEERAPSEGGPRASSDEERFHSASEGEARRSSEEERFHSARGSSALGDEGDEGPGRQSAHNVSVYQVLFEGDAEDDSGPDYQWPPHRHHDPITEDDWETRGMQTNQTNSEQATSNSERPNQCICVKEDSNPPNGDCLTVKDSGTDGTQIEREEREQQMDASEPIVDPQRQNRDGQRRIVGNLDLYILNDSSEFDWEPVPEASEELSLASQPIGGVEFDEDSLEKYVDIKSSSAHSQTENQFRDAPAVVTRDGDEPDSIELNIQNVDPQVTVQPERQQDSIPTVEHEVAVDLERAEENTQNVENGSRSTRIVKGDRKSI